MKRAFVGLTCITLFAACNRPEKQNPSDSSPNIPQAKIYRAGTPTMTLPGVSVPPPQPNSMGPFVFRRIDLDEGKEAPESGKDVEVQINARDFSVYLHADRAAEAGSAQGSYDGCRKVLSASQGKIDLGPKRVPTGYVCLVTKEGRISLFRVLRVYNVPRPNMGPNMFDIFLEYEFTTWER